MNPKVAVIILNWNGWEDTIECLESLYQITYPSFNVIVVDNDSKDDSIKKIKNYCEGKIKPKSKFFKYTKDNKPIKTIEYTLENLNSPGISLNDHTNTNLNKLILIKNNENYGFAEGNNIGIDYALEHLETDYILLLNNDTVVDKDFLNELILFSNKYDEIGIVGPTVFRYDDPKLITYIGGHVDICHSKIIYLHLDETKNCESVPEEIDYISGCSLLIKREVIKHIGLLDPDYFLYYEDIDWCLRAKKEGYKLFYVPKAKIWHKVSASVDNSSTSLYYGTRNQFLLMKKNCKKRIKVLFIRFVVDRLISIRHYLIKRDVEKSILSFKILIDVVRGKYGYKKF